MSLDWGNERYVRLYTRDTPDWIMLPWQSRALFPLLLRRVDRRGGIDIGKHGTKALAISVGLPAEVTEDGLRGLIADGCITLDGNRLTIRNFVPAQESKASGAQRVREHREKKKYTVLDQTVCNETLQNVTSGNSVKHVETPSLAQPSLAKLSLAKKPEETNPPSAGNARAKGSRIDLGKPDNRAQGRLVDTWYDQAVEIFRFLVAERKRVNHAARELAPTYQALAGIASRLEAGKTPDDCRHVIAVTAAECSKNPESFRWFNAITPFRPEQFERKLAADVQTPEGPRRWNGAVIGVGTVSQVEKTGEEVLPTWNELKKQGLV